MGMTETVNFLDLVLMYILHTFTYNVMQASSKSY